MSGNGNGQNKCTVCGKDISSPGMCAECEKGTDDLINDLGNGK